MAATALAVIGACRPAVRPDQADDTPVPPPPPVKHSAPAPQRAGLIGELCPQAAAGRPGLSPLAVRDVSWSSEHDDVVAPLARGAAAQFTVLAFDGHRAGVFSAVGTADIDGIDVAIGSYAGASPCTHAEGQVARDDDACVKATRGCGLAVAALGAGGGAFTDLDAPAVVTGGACQSGDALAIDVDGDGTAEVFPIAAFVDPVRAPSDEVAAAAMVAPTCAARFSVFGVAVAPDPAFPDDAKHRLALDVLGVLDLDGDGRREVVIAYRYAERRTIAVYSAIEAATRLELVGETAPWPPSS